MGGNVQVFWEQDGKNEARWIEIFSDMKQGEKQAR